MTATGQETRLSGSRAKALSAGALVALIVILGVVLTVKGMGNDKSADQGSRPTEAPTAQPTKPAPGDSSACGLNKVKMDGALSSPPESVQWELVGGIAVPSAPGAGPGKRSEAGVRYCYARTPAGALMMAANTFVWGSIPTNQVIDVVERQFASGAGYESALSQAKAAAGRAPEQPPASTLQIRGFRLGFYDGNSAVVEIAVQDRDGQTYRQAFELLWEQSDWRLRVSPAGTVPQGQSIPDLTGFVPFAGA